jgi:hypothetical protein
MVHQIAAHHLKRLACLYVRQSTLQQVFENTESTARQYALRDRALALGWAEERILVIDQDLGHSAASTADRLGGKPPRGFGGARTGGAGLRAGSFPTRTQRKLLAPSLGNVCSYPDSDSGRRRSLRSIDFQ